MRSIDRNERLSTREEIMAWLTAAGIMASAIVPNKVLAYDEDEDYGYGDTYTEEHSTSPKPIWSRQHLIEQIKANSNILDMLSQNSAGRAKLKAITIDSEGKFSPESGSLLYYKIKIHHLYRPEDNPLKSKNIYILHKRSILEGNWNGQTYINERTNRRLSIVPGDQPTFQHPMEIMGTQEATNWVIEKFHGTPYGHTKVSLDCMSFPQAVSKRLKRFGLSSPELSTYTNYLKTTRNQQGPTYGEFFKEQYESNNKVFYKNDWENVRTYLSNHPGKYLIAFDKRSARTKGPWSHGGFVEVTNEGQMMLTHASIKKGVTSVDLEKYLKWIPGFKEGYIHLMKVSIQKEQEGHKI